MDILNKARRNKQNKCCVPGCDDRTSKRHRFPREAAFRQQWLTAIKLTSNDFTGSARYVCNKHFEPSFIVPGTRRGLSAIAVPTLFLPEPASEPQHHQDICKSPQPRGATVETDEVVVISKIRKPSQFIGSTEEDTVISIDNRDHQYSKPQAKPLKTCHFNQFACFGKDLSLNMSLHSYVCIVCGNRSDNVEKLHTFPRNLTRRQAWFDALGFRCSVSELPSSARICNSHFSSESYLAGFGNRWKLRKEAVPKPFFDSNRIESEQLLNSTSDFNNENGQQNKLQSKLEMDGRNTFTCNFHLGADTISEGDLSFSYVPLNSYLQVCSIDGILTAKIFLNNICGYNHDGTTLTLTLKPEVFPENRRAVVLTFPSVVECELAFAKLQNLRCEIESNCNPRANITIVVVK